MIDRADEGVFSAFLLAHETGMPMGDRIFVGRDFD
jgi:hypothetical protein